MNRTRRSNSNTQPWQFPLALGYVLLAAAAAWVVVYAVFTALPINAMQGAAADYWQVSQTVGQLISSRYLPVYPALISGLHNLLPALAPLLLMQLISLGGWLLSIICVYLILETLFVEMTWQGTLLYAVFPFVGVFEIVYPRADGVAAYLLTCGLLAFLHKRRVLAVTAFALALLTHPAAWLIVLLASTTSLVQRHKRLTVVEGLVAFAPLVVYALDGFRRSGDPLWFLRGITNFSGADPGALLIFDGLASLLQRGDTLGLAVFVGLLIVIALALLLILTGSWRSHPWLLALTVPLLVYAVVLNRDAIWMLARYSIFLVLPLWVYLDEAFVWQIGPLRLRPLLPVIIALAFATQLLTSYAAYTTAAPLLFSGS